MDEKPHYGRGQHPNSRANLQKGGGFDQDRERARRANKTSVANQRAWKSLSTIITTELDKDDGKLKDLLGKRVLKMALDGNLAAIQYVVKLIGEEPADKVDITTADFSALDNAISALSLTAEDSDPP